MSPNLEKNSNSPESSTLNKPTSLEKLFENSEKKKDFYKLFLKPEILAKVASSVRYNYPSSSDDWDEETGEVIPGELNDSEIISYLQTKLGEYTTAPEDAQIEFLEGVPVVYLNPENVTQEYSDSGAFVIGGSTLPLAIGIVKDPDTNQNLDLQHELVHLATRYTSIGNLESVQPKYSEFYEIENQTELDQASLARNFVDEALAYGTNAFAHNYTFTPEMIQNSMFYSSATAVGDYNVEENARQWADILNKSVADRTGRAQFHLNYYLVKNVQTLADLDLTNPEIKGKITSKIDN